MSDSDLIERVDRDPMLSGDEKDPTITMYGQDKEFSVYSAKPTIIKSLLHHDHVELEWARITGGIGTSHVHEREALHETDGDVVAVEGRMPVGVLTVKSVHGRTISRPLSTPKRSIRLSSNNDQSET